MLLCIAMVLPYIPELVLPTKANTSTVSEETVYVLANSDFQGEYENKQHDTTAQVNTLKTILSKTGRISYGGFMFLGDYNLGDDDNSVKGLSVLKNALSGYSLPEWWLHHLYLR